MKIAIVIVNIILITLAIGVVLFVIALIGD